MLSQNSILRRLPPGLDKKQLVFLEGIRHSAEIAWLAYVRLERALTHFVDSPNGGSPEPERYTEAFMDAWAVVDSIDRFRQLWSMFPGMQFVEPRSGKPSFAELSHDIRQLRNVTDHLAQRAEYIAASGNPVFGLLTWVTLGSSPENQAFTCLLAPGSLKKSHWTAVNPAGRELTCYATGRTGLIHLAAGEHRANLTAVIPEMTERIKELECGLEDAFASHGLTGKQAGADLFIALQLSFDQSPTEVREDDS